MRAQEPAVAVATMGTPLILLIGGSRNITKIFKAIITRIAIDMIDMLFWPFACDIKPNQTMHIVSSALHPGDRIAVRSLVPDDRPSRNFRSRNDGSHCSRTWIIRDNLAQTFCSKIRFSHEAPQMLIGERLAAIGVAANLAIIA